MVLFDCHIANFKLLKSLQIVPIISILFCIKNIWNENFKNPCNISEVIESGICSRSSGAVCLRRTSARPIYGTVLWTLNRYVICFRIQFMSSMGKLRPPRLFFTTRLISPGSNCVRLFYFSRETAFYTIALRSKIGVSPLEPERSSSYLMPWPLFPISCY